MKRKEKLLCLCATLVAVTAFGGIPKWISGDEVLSPVTCQPNLRHSSVTRDITNLLRVGRDKQILLAAAFAMGVL